MININRLHKIVQFRRFQHFIFWFSILISIFSITYFGGYGLALSLLFSTSIAILIPIPVYINFYLLDKYLFKKKYWQYILILITIITLSAFLCHFYFYNIIGLLKNNVLQWSVDIIIAIVITTSVKFVKRGYTQKMLLQKLENQHLTAENQLLKAQLNPHFLFNTLNNLYSLSLNNSAETPDIILKLSKLMRYMTEAGQKDLVSLKQEVDFIKDYIEMEKLRLRSSENVILNANEVSSNFIIAPMILLPFIENIFKHGGTNSNGVFYVEINIFTEGQKLIFNCSNSVNHLKASEKMSMSTGLTNIRKRMDLMYSGRYELKIISDENSYRINLAIEF
jgi:two-component system, LytTR family, sensor kinase